MLIAFRIICSVISIVVVLIYGPRDLLLRSKLPNIVIFGQLECQKFLPAGFFAL